MTKKQRQEIADREIRKRRQATEAVAPLLREWKEKLKGERRCPVCGEGMIETFQKHHINGDKRNNGEENLAYICGSCHTLTFSTPERLEEMWRERHDRWMSLKNAAKKAWESRKKR